MLLIFVSGCGTQTVSPHASGTGGASQAPEAGEPTLTTTGGPVMSGTGLTGPPPFRLRHDGYEFALNPYAWCYDRGCVDGFSTDPPSVGSPASIRVFVPVEDWDLVATFTPADERCGRRQTVTPTKQADGWYVLEPAGHAGSYDVDLFAQGRGSSIARFRWITTTEGKLPTPAASLALIADHDGRPDSYGVELTLDNLADTPRAAQARITVTASNGRSLTFDASRAQRKCSPEGTVYFDGPDAQGRAAAALGDFPFHYEVAVTIDGATHRASADYPAEEIHGNEPSVELSFMPALPALQ